MRRLMKRAFLTAAAVGGTLLMMGGSTAGIAGATVVPSAPIPTTSQAGYVATQNTFRYVTTTVTVPAKSAHHGSFAEVVLGGTKYPATLGVKAGGGVGSVQFDVVGPLGGMGGGTMNIAPEVGDVLTLSIYYNQKSGLDNFTVTDVTQSVTRALSLPPTPGVVYRAAEAACLLPGLVAAPSADVKLWAFTSTHVTTLAGTRGTMNGPWLTRKIIDVTPSGRVVMSPSWLWNNGHKFTAWLRSAK